MLGFLSGGPYPRKALPQNQGYKTLTCHQVPMSISGPGLGSHFRIIYGLIEVTPQSLGSILGKCTTDWLHV